MSKRKATVKVYTPSDSQMEDCRYVITNLNVAFIIEETRNYSNQYYVVRTELTTMKSSYMRVDVTKADRPNNRLVFKLDEAWIQVFNKYKEIKEHYLKIKTL